MTLMWFCLCKTRNSVKFALELKHRYDSMFHIFQKSDSYNHSFRFCYLSLPYTVKFIHPWSAECICYVLWWTVLTGNAISISVELYSNFPGSQSIEFFTVNTKLTMFTVLALTVFFQQQKEKLPPVWFDLVIFCAGLHCSANLALLPSLRL